MNFSDTQVVLDSLRDICNWENITISTEQTDYLGRVYRSDFVFLEQEHEIGFEVFENEIIVFGFGNHNHFANYTCEDLDDGHVQNAIEHLRFLFTMPLQIEEKWHGRRLLRRSWYHLQPNGEKTLITHELHGELLLNPFVRSTIKVTVWQYSKEQGQFLLVP